MYVEYRNVSKPGPYLTVLRTIGMGMCGIGGIGVLLVLSQHLGLSILFTSGVLRGLHCYFSGVCRLEESKITILSVASAWSSLEAGREPFADRCQSRKTWDVPGIRLVGALCGYCEGHFCRAASF